MQVYGNSTAKRFYKRLHFDLRSTGQGSEENSNTDYRKISLQNRLTVDCESVTNIRMVLSEMLSQAVQCSKCCKPLPLRLKDQESYEN